MTTMRTIQRLIDTQAVRDGAGVNIRRIAGSPETDPFLMLDEFGSDDPSDYIAGFPEHPHRGFETVTYMLAGHMEHHDSVGNHGRLGPGDVQWMTAGRGIIHSEMPLQEEGLMRGFQLWVNLPSEEKMRAPRYQEIASAEIPLVEEGGVSVKVIAGVHAGVVGAVEDIPTSPTYLDLRLDAGAAVQQSTKQGHTAMVYVYEGQALIGGEANATVSAGCAAVLSSSGEIRISAAGRATRALLLSARPLGEPVVQYGPFVMNSREEIEQAIADFQAGRFAS